MTNAAKKYYSRKVIPLSRHRAYRYPNAADKLYRQARLTDLALICMTCLGAGTTLVFFMLL